MLANALARNEVPRTVTLETATASQEKNVRVKDRKFVLDNNGQVEQKF